MKNPLSKGLALLLATICFTAFPSESNAQDSGKNWYKGNLHTHSLWSDGDDFPDMIVRWYVENDYQFLALTDHNILSEGEKWMAANAITKRGGDDVIEKYRRIMGDEIVEIRDRKNGGKEVRLRTFAECKKQFNKQESFMLMSGEEISDKVNGKPLHINATNLQNLLSPTSGASIREAMQANIRAARLQATKLEREILVHLNHPNFGWAITAEDLAAVTEEQFFEVYNGHPGVNHLGNKDHPSVEKIWDIANTIRTSMLGAQPLLGLATDDCHYYHGRKGSQPGRGWIMVRSSELTEDSILKSIKAGDFYASSGVEIENFRFDSSTGKISFEIKGAENAEYETKFIGTLKSYDQSSEPRTNDKGETLKATRVYSDDVGKTLATEKGNSVEYQMTGNELYVRATITSSKKHPNPSFKNQSEQAWIQPIVWKK